MESSTFFDYSFTRKDGCTFIEGSKTVKIDGDNVHVDTGLLFQVYYFFIKNDLYFVRVIQNFCEPHKF